METIVTDFRVNLGEQKDELSNEQFNETYKATCEQLGMSKLIDRYTSKDEAKTGFIVPYQRIDKEFKRAFSILFDSSQSIEEYTHDQPPMEALGLIMFAKMQDVFSEIYIKFHNTDPDPVAIGKKDNEEFLICAWGPDKVSRETFLERAKKKLEIDLPKKIDEMIEFWNAQKQMMNPLISKIVKGEWVHLGEIIYYNS